MRRLAMSVLVLLMGFSPLYSQELGEMQYEEESAMGAIPDDPSVSLLIVESTIPHLQFTSRKGIRTVQEKSASLYYIVLDPGVDYITITSDGYLPLDLGRMNFVRKGTKKIKVSSKLSRKTVANKGTVKLILPPGEVFLIQDGVSVGTVNVPNSGILSLELSKGEHSLSLFREGFETVELTVDIALNSTITRTIELTPTDRQVELPESQFGILVVRSTPAGATVRIDGVETGTTPLQLKSIAVGQHAIGIEKLLYNKYYETTKIESDRVTEVVAKLDPDFAPVTVISSPGNANVRVDGNLVGRTPYEDPQLSSGRHVIQVEKLLYHEFTDTAEVVAGVKKVINAQLAPKFGSVIFTSVPSGADVFVKGQRWGVTPLEKDTILSGDYPVLIRTPLHLEWEKMIHISDSKKTKVEAILVPHFGTVQIRSKPEGASITIIGESKPSGDTPLEIQLEPGAYTIQAELAGYVIATETITLETGDQKMVTVNLERKTGTLAVIAEPADAEIFLDGNRIGKTPQIVNDLPEGRHTLEIQLDGYTPIKEEIRIGYKGRVEKDYTLVKRGGIKLTSKPTKASVQLNGKLVGNTPLTLTGMKEGQYQINIKKYGYTPISDTVHVKDGEIVEKVFELNNNPNLVLETDPIRASVMLDGINYGLTPLKIQSLRSGIHKLDIEKDGFYSLQKSVVLKNTETNKLFFNLKKIPTFTPNLIHAELLGFQFDPDSYIMDMLVLGGSISLIYDNPELHSWYLQFTPVRRSNNYKIVGNNVDGDFSYITNSIITIEKILYYKNNKNYESLMINKNKRRYVNTSIVPTVSIFTSIILPNMKPSSTRELHYIDKDNDIDGFADELTLSNAEGKRIGFMVGIKLRVSLFLDFMVGYQNLPEITYDAKFRIYEGGHDSGPLEERIKIVPKYQYFFSAKFLLGAHFMLMEKN